MWLSVTGVRLRPVCDSRKKKIFPFAEAAFNEVLLGVHVTLDLLNLGSKFGFQIVRSHATYSLWEWKARLPYVASAGVLFHNRGPSRGHGPGGDAE